MSVQTRRRICACLAALAIAPVTRAFAKSGLDGTWGGALNGVTAQVIVTGASVIGFYWRSDYVDAANVKFVGDAVLSFTFPRGSAVLRRTGERTARISVTEGGKVTHFSLKRD